MPSTPRTVRDICNLSPSWVEAGPPDSLEGWNNRCQAEIYNGLESRNLNGLTVFWSHFFNGTGNAVFLASDSRVGSFAQEYCLTCAILIPGRCMRYGMSPNAAVILHTLHADCGRSCAGCADPFRCNDPDCERCLPCEDCGAIGHQGCIGYCEDCGEEFTGAGSGSELCDQCQYRSEYGNPLGCPLCSEQHDRPTDYCQGTNDPRWRDAKPVIQLLKITRQAAFDGAVFSRHLARSRELIHL